MKLGSKAIVVVLVVLLALGVNLASVGCGSSSPGAPTTTSAGSSEVRSTTTESTAATTFPAAFLNQPVWDGLLYDSVYKPADAAMLASSLRYCDVQCPRPPGSEDNLWEKGGVVHLWGGGKPRVVVLGSSHALGYGNQIDMICRKLGVSVSFLAADGRAAIQFDPKITAFYQAQQRWLAQWKPDVVIVTDRWDSRAKDIKAFSASLKGYLTMLQASTSHIVLLTQPPVLPVGETNNLRQYVYSYYETNLRPPDLRPDGAEAFRQETVSVFEAATKTHRDLQVIRADQFFYNGDGSVKYFSGSQYLYADDDHVSEAGAALLHQSLENAIAADCGLTNQ